MASETGSRGVTKSLRNIRLAALFTPDDVIVETEADTQEKVIRQLLERLAIRYGIGNVDEAYREVMDHIEKGGVSVAPGVVVPYARMNFPLHLRVAVATSKKGISFGDNLAHVIFLIVVPIDMPGAYMQTLQGISKFCKKENATEKIIASRSGKEVWEFFDTGSTKLPDHLLARHVMTDVNVALKESDNLARAIDLFLEHNSTELPVIDDDGELIGVVTTTRLVRVCMPDYLLWLEDVTPLLNFEPFAEIIRNEGSTWLNDIMTGDFAKVEENSPAIMAIKEISMHKSNYAYVLRDRKLVGIIRLHEFLRQVLR